MDYIVYGINTNEPNANGRIYHPDALVKAIEEYKEVVAQGRGVVELRDNNDPKIEINYLDVCAKVEDINYDKDEGVVITSISTPISTPKGGIYKDLLDLEVPLTIGMSCVGRRSAGGMTFVEKIVGFSFIQEQGDYSDEL